MFPIYLYDDKKLIPKEDIAYLIGKNGIFIKKHSPIVDALVPVDKISCLEEIKSYGVINVPKLPKEIGGLTYKFMKKMYEKYHSESIVMLFYSPEKGFRLYCPFQNISSASIKYLKPKTFRGYTLIGTIHSHAGFSAFHSGVDDSDEFGFDGLHVTFGNFSDEKTFTISCSCVVNGKRFMYDPKDYFEGLTVIKEFTKTWDYRIQGYNTTPSNKFMFKEKDLKKINIPTCWDRRINQPKISQLKENIGELKVNDFQYSGRFSGAYREFYEGYGDYLFGAGGSNYYKNYGLIDWAGKTPTTDQKLRHENQKKINALTEFYKTEDFEPSMLVDELIDRGLCFEIDRDQLEAVIDTFFNGEIVEDDAEEGGLAVS